METTAGSAVWTGDGRQLKLEVLLKSGGAGSVYRLQGTTGEVAKIYHAHVDHAHYARKIEAMLKLSPQLPDLNDGGRRFVQIAWPQATLRDKRGKFLGFLMPAVDVRATSELECILQEKQARALKLPTGLGAKITLAANLAAVIAELHAQRHYVVDLKPVNLRFYPQSLYMAMLDCDGFSIQGQGERFAAPQITPDYLAPEFQAKALTAAGEEQQDRFALAVVVFQLLNFGLHPYSGRPRTDALATDIPGRIRQRAYAYGLRANTHQLPNLSSGHQAMPMDLRTLFDRAFDGADAGRPSAAEWRSLLTGYAQRTNQRLLVCRRNAEHQHYAGQACAACERADLLAKARAAPKRESRPARIPPSARQRPNPFARPSAPPAPPAWTRQPVQPRARRPMPYVPLPRAPQPAPPSLPWQVAAWFFSLLFNNPRATVALVMFVVMLFLRSQDGASNRQEDRHRDTPVPVDASQASEAPRASRAEPPPLETAPELGVASAPIEAQGSGVSEPSESELGIAESDIREAANALTSERVNDYARSMGSLYATAYRRSSASGSDPYGARFNRFMNNLRDQDPTERRELIRDLQQALVAEPTAAEPAFQLGCLSLASGGRLGAREYFVRTIWADPNHGAAWYAYGAIASEDGVALGAMANAMVVSGNQRFRSKVPNSLLEQGGVDTVRIAKLSQVAAKLSKQQPINAADKEARENGWNDAQR